MKISAIEQICKGAKRIELYSSEAVRAQWISDGGAFYPLYNLPPMQEANVYVFFDIPEKKQDKIRFEHLYELPKNIDFADYDEAENPLEFCNISIKTRGKTLVPLKTQIGVVYVNEKYLKPFSDAENGVQLYDRYTPSGKIYIAVKEGFLLTGIILPEEIVTEEFVNELKTIYKLSEISAQNKKIYRGSEQEEIDYENDIEE